MRAKTIYPLLALALLSTSVLVSAEQEPRTQQPSRTVRVDSMFSSYPKLEQQAKEIGEALVRKDFQRFAELTYPKLIQMAGGREKFKKAMADEMKQEETQGLEVLSSIPTDVTQFLRVSGSLYAVMPTTQRMKMRGKLFESYGCLVGISTDRGEHWTFVDPGSGGLKDLIPAVANKITPCPEKRPVQLE